MHIVDRLPHFMCIYFTASDFEGDDMNLHMKLLSLLDNPAVIVAAAASGSASNLREFLLKHPSDVSLVIICVISCSLVFTCSCFA